MRADLGNSVRNIAPFDLPRGISMARFGLPTSVACKRRTLQLLALSGCLSCLLGVPREATAQNTIGGGATAGVAVDADGVLRRVMKDDPTGDLSRQRIQEALTRLDHNIAKPSKLRKVSLTRLERIIKENLSKGQPIDDAMQHLAGLNRIR